MSDIVERIRSLRFVHVPGTSDLMEEAAAEIERLRSSICRLADQDATLSVQGGSVTVTMDATLTDEEREAVLAMACHCDTRSGLEWVRLSAILRGLLERLGGER